MSNLPRLDSHDGDGSQAILPSRQMRMVPAQYVRPGIPGIPTVDVAESDDVTVLMQYLRVIWGRKWTVALGALLGILAGLGMCVWTVPVYYARTTVEIQDVNEPFGVGGLVSGSATLSTQIQLISSQTMLDRVKGKLYPKQAPYPEVQDPLANLRHFVGLGNPAKSIKWPVAVSIAAGSTRVATNKDSRILLIESRSPHPQAAADFANTLALEYIARNKEERWASYKQTGEWLDDAQEELKKKIENDQRRLQEFAKTHGLLITGGSQNVTEEKLKALQGELAQASADRIKKEAVYESSLSSPTEALPEVLDSGPVGQYQGQISDLKRQLADLTTTYTSEHTKVKRVQAQLDEVLEHRERERKNILSRIRIDFEAAKKREAKLEEDFKSQAKLLSGEGEELIQYNILQQEIESNKKLYDLTLAQGKQAGLASAMRTSNARVVDAADMSLVPQSPNIQLNLSLGMMLGLIGGSVFVVVRTKADARIQAPGTLGLQLNLRELGVIPSASMFPELRAAGLLRKVVGGKKDKRIADSTTILIPSDDSRSSQEPLELITWTQKTSVMSEAFRSAMASILFSSDYGSQPQVLVVTSPAPQEGKTTVTTNLAIALAEIKHRVLLIDADMRRPRLHSIFDQPNTFGLSDFLHERRPVEEYVDEELIRKTHVPNLYVMLAGPARSNFSRLLYSTRMTEMLSRFRNSFDMILIDSAPVLSVPDARILARASDAVVLVLRAHHTHQDSAFAAVRCFEEDGCRVLGTVLNGWNPKHAPYGNYGEYGQYSYSAYGMYGSRYGENPKD